MYIFFQINPPPHHKNKKTSFLLELYYFLHVYYVRCTYENTFFPYRLEM
jgi:hypothetical protein